MRRGFIVNTKALKGLFNSRSFNMLKITALVFSILFAVSSFAQEDTQTRKGVCVFVKGDFGQELIACEYDEDMANAYDSKAPEGKEDSLCVLDEKSQTGIKCDVPVPSSIVL